MCKMTLFVYGSLKRGHWNHHYCQGAGSIEKATVCGKLYQLPPGFPALQVPNESVLHIGTKDVFIDAQEQYRINDDMDFEYEIHEGWDTVHGELVTFSDPEDEVPEIDKLEGRPFWYDRVLVPARKANGMIMATYVYTMDDIHFSARYLPDGVWPEKRQSKKGT